MKASFSVSEEEISKLQSQFNSQSENLDNVRQAKQELEQELENLASKINKWEVEIPKIEMDLAAMATQEKELKVRLPQLEERAQLGDEEEEKIKQIKKVLKEQEKVLEEIKKNCSKLDQTVQNLHKQISEAGGTRLKVQKAKVDSLNERMDHANSTITKAKVGIKTTEKVIYENSENFLRKMKKNEKKIGKK